MSPMTIRPDVYTGIKLFSGDPARQETLLREVTDYVTQAQKKQPGFVAAALHKSLDGVRVMLYTQWATASGYEADEENLLASRLTTRYKLLDTHLYSLAVSRPEWITPQITVGSSIHLAEFRVRPENVVRLVQLERENVEVGLQHPDLVSANFHRSLDGTRTVNYGQWKRLDRFNELLTDPKYKALNAYWQGLAENEFHLYEVAWTESGN